MKKNEHGFGAIEALLVVVIIAIVSFAGWWVYRSKNATNKTLTDTSNSQGEPSKSAKSTTPASSTTYLTIKEWAVRLPVPSTVNIGDIYYVIKTDIQNGNSEEAVLASTQLSNIASNCDVNKSGSTPFGSIERMSTAAYQTASQDSKNTGVDNGQKLGDYYYVWQVPRANCYATQAQGDKTISDKMAALPKPIDNFPSNMTTLLKKLEATK